MVRARFLLGLVFAVLVVAGSLHGQDKGAAAKGTLPRGWGKLGLSDEQKQKIFAIQNQYRAQIQELQQKLAEVRKIERTEMEQVLSADQRKRLREIALQRAPADTDEKGKTKEKGK